MYANRQNAKKKNATTLHSICMPTANTTQTTKNMLIISHNMKKKYICQHNRNKNKNTHNTLQQKDCIYYI